jgi:hypothetical protein
MVAGMGILQTIWRWRSVEVFDTITSVGAWFGWDKAETWLFVQVGAAAVLGLARIMREG